MAGAGERAGGPGAPALLLVPTDLEARHLEDAGGLPPHAGLPYVCGFGPVVAAARAAGLLERLRPRRALLLGIAGTYDLAGLPVGAAARFAAVAIDGIGAGEGAGFLGPRAVGLPQWPGGHGAAAPETFERLELAPGPAGPLLVTVCAAAADAAQAARRRERFPGAAAEDMEGFGVAAACALAGVPLTIVRGIANAAGEREPRHWRIGDAMAAARRLALELLRAEVGP